MPNRPAIPVEIQREVLFESRHRCAVCCEPLPLEYAHIIPWHETQDHSLENLIALCANCHSRADKENWGNKYLYKYKQRPCALEKYVLPPLSSAQQMLVDVIVTTDPEHMTEYERQMLASMFAAFLGVPFSHVEVVSVTAANSSRIRIRLAQEAAERLVAAFNSGDPWLQAFLDDIEVLAIEPVIEDSHTYQVTDTSEWGLESLIVHQMVEHGWIEGQSADYDRGYAIDLKHLQAFVEATQPDAAEALRLHEDSPARHKFLTRLSDEIRKRGIIDVLRNGVKHGPTYLTLFYGTPSPDNPRAVALNAQNRFVVTRQLMYSPDETRRALDLCLFINGLPVATFELKNNLTKQTVEDAVQQYKRDRNPRETLFQFGRCMVHLAVDDSEVRMCTELKGKASWFLPFNKGWNDGAGNPPNPYGLKTAYLWQEVLTPSSLTNIVENYAQLIEKRDQKTGKKRQVQIFPRYHQLDVVRELLAHVQESGAGYRYLIQHSAGSGKSYSIAWLAHQLVGLERDDAVVFNSIIVVTDRIILDQQINETIKQYMQVRATVGHADSARDLRKFIEGGKKIVITTVQKFPFILEEIGQAHRGGNFAIIIDEAHSSQGGRTAAAVNIALTDAGDDPDDIETTEDQINRIIEEMTKKKQMPQNASYFAFTATPKNKTLELFGEPYHEDGQVKHRPFHTYTMKQAIEERFILDVLQSYTPVQSYYRLVKTTEADPEFETSRAIRKLHRYVEAHDHAIRLKAEIIVDHFHEQVLAARKINGQARAMVVTERVNRAIAYYYAIQSYLEERNSRYRALVAFSGEREYQGSKVSEASLNGFPSAKTAERFQDDPYRFLIVADKFQTGYDEPLLHTMYVDKTLAGIRAVQTLSRLNRAHPYKHDVFVLDFMNDADMIQRAFEPYYRSTILSSETDPNKLHDLQAELEGYQVYTDEDIDQLVELYLSGAERDQLDPILDHCVAAYVEYLDEDGQVGFKGRAKAFTRTYNFLVSILPYSNIWWEKLSIFLNFLIPKLPAPVEEDPTRGLIEVIDMESYRVEKQATIKIALADEDTEIEPVPTGGVGLRPEVKVDILSNIIAMFNDQFGNIEWTDEDRVRRLITEELPEAVLADEKYANAVKHSGRQNARVELSAALQRVIFNILKDDSELLKQFLDNPSFNKWLEDAIFALTYVESP